jgi:hypothetical protein
MMNQTIRMLISLCFYVALIGIFIYPIVQDETISTNVGVAIIMLGGFYFAFLNDIYRELVKLNSRFDEAPGEDQEKEPE